MSIIKKSKQEIYKTIAAAKLWGEALDGSPMTAEKLHEYQHPHRDLYVGITKIFTNAEILTRLLKVLEKRFKTFLQTYFPEHRGRMAHKPEFETWYYYVDYIFEDQVPGQNIPYMLPLPTKNDLHIAKQWKAEDALILFCFQELLAFNILPQKATVESHILYAMGFIDHEVIQTHMREGGVFVECGPTRILAHGKYSHLIQLILIAIAIYTDEIVCDVQLNNLVECLLEKPPSSANSLLQITPLQTFWDMCIDTVTPMSIQGAQGFNVVLLALGEKHFPTLHRYLSFSYIKKLMEQACHERLRIEDCLANIVKNILVTTNVSYAYKAGYVENHSVQELSKNLYRKNHEGSDKFKSIEARIIAANQLYSTQQASTQTRKRFLCF